MSMLAYEPTWLITLVWLGLMFLSMKWEKGILPYAAVIIGIFSGISFVQNINLIVGIALVFINLGLLWHFLMRGNKL